MQTNLFLQLCTSLQLEKKEHWLAARALGFTWEDKTSRNSRVWKLRSDKLQLSQPRVFLAKLFMADRKNFIMICEHLLQSGGFNDSMVLKKGKMLTKDAWYWQVGIFISQPFDTESEAKKALKDNKIKWQE